jgi:acyl-CoA synthetase (AMP-forming)/AMP-acid ligase II
MEPGLLVTDSTEICDAWPGGRVAQLQELASAAAGSYDTSPEHPGAIVVLTTGTTGPPKAVLYRWDRLLSQARTGANGPSRWCLLYPLNHFAGLQMLLHVLKNRAYLAIPRGRQFQDVLSAFVGHEIDAASGTPTFWRMFAGRLTPETARGLSLRQITLGGEPATADILNRLASLFPDARVTHVYATTEIGSCFAVSDGLPGFPASYLNDPPSHVQLRIAEGELHVRSGMGMEGYVNRMRGEPPDRAAEDWRATGDLVELRGDRVMFLGRKTETINVGGVKVFPPLVEERIRLVPGVRDVRVYGKSNPISGHIVAAELELVDGFAEANVLASVRAACRASLSRYEEPRLIRVVPTLARSNEKIVRICSEEQSS